MIIGDCFFFRKKKNPLFIKMKSFLTPTVSRFKGISAIFFKNYFAVQNNLSKEKPPTPHKKPQQKKIHFFVKRVNVLTLKQTCCGEYPTAPFAFKDSMIH